jgi:hypothetical protein
MHSPELLTALGWFRAVHCEKQPHKYAASLTTERSCGDEAGGHFFISKYGIRIQAAPNTLVVWSPSEYHGTSLQDFSPLDEDPAFSQRGLAFVTSPRLKGVWEKYKKNLVDQVEALEALYGPNAECDELFG